MPHGQRVGPFPRRDPLRFLVAQIEKIAMQEGKSKSVVAKELMEDALEKHEDLLLSVIAMRRESKSKRTVSHVKAWR